MNLKSEKSTREKCEEIIKYREEKRRNKKIGIIITAIIISISFIGLYTLYLNKKEKENLVAATKTLCAITDFGYEDYVEYTPEDNYVTDKNIKTDYYIFTLKSADFSRFNFLVDKKDFNIYLTDANGVFLSYKSSDSNTGEGDYFKDYYFNYYESLPESTSNYIKVNGGKAFLEKMKEIMEDADTKIIKYYGEEVNYVDLIISGKTKEDLNKNMYHRLNGINESIN